MKIALTGHRTERLNGHEEDVYTWIENTLSILFAGQQEKEVLCGMAEGADKIFGLAAKDLFKEEVKLHLCMPCKYYGEKNADKNYWYLMENASEITYMQARYSRGCDDERDRYMVDNCDILLAVWDGIPVGGVWSTIKYAKKVGKLIIFIGRDKLI